MQTKILIPVLSVLMLTGIYSANPVKLHNIKTNNAAAVKDFMRYTPDRLPFICAHRGGPRKGFPENCIETFENTLAQTPAMLEIDPHYTKDGKIVLMHDPTLDRTSNGHGKIADFTLEELKKLRLKDTEGNLTDYHMPTLDEALQWAKGKTILVIDAKDVPIEVRAQKIVENNALGNAIVIAYSIEDIKKCYDHSKDVVMEIMMGKPENITALDNSGVPWANVIGFVSHDMPADKTIFSEVHKRGAMCILGSSRNIDKQFTTGKINADELKTGYLNLINHGADVIEADLGIEAGTALKDLQGAKSSKSKYFSK
ncbi:glycerophosphodiester phosphodiesterase [Chitinophaga sp. SYP-B3965]|uniref:glycerophosphodiester phosphodiesterase family protein n=1 Tax=Chitinophaga sp. SYP-B3965 TaxID=2663120 RepID=UPI001299AFC9|nr:glycerophosphodiester phosphodiesterase family protein [Chitinophaga sp. SYP-B3965]MRG46897.1 glycerophosphodiester phosphodiesterase [Chitinophaga sp. SYP-B3965]